MRGTPPPGFVDFVVARGPSLQRTAVLLTRDHHRAEDLVQTALARAWGSWERVHGDHEAYVRRILVNEFASSWRRRWNDERPSEVPCGGRGPAPGVAGHRPGGRPAIGHGGAHRPLRARSRTAVLPSPAAGAGAHDPRAPHDERRRRSGSRSPWWQDNDLRDGSLVFWHPQTRTFDLDEWLRAGGGKRKPGRAGHHRDPPRRLRSAGLDTDGSALTRRGAHRRPAPERLGA